MTVLCGGPSQAKKGIDRYVYMTSSTAGALLNNIPTKWAVPLAAFLGSATYDMTQFCTTDPPAMPTITALDAVNILTSISNPLTGLASLQKITDLVKIYLWYQACECASVATPAAPSPPSQPTDWPAFDPGYLPQPTAAKCSTIAASRHFGPFPVTQGGSFDIFIPGTGDRGAPASNAPNNLSLPLPVGASTAVITSTHTSVTGDTLSNFGFPFVAYNAAGSAVASSTNNALGDDGRTRSAGIPLTKTTTVVIPSTATQWRFVAQWSANSNTGNGDMTVSIDFYCGGANPGVPVGPCCPPDTTLAAQVLEILDAVTLIQRQIAPFAYVNGPIHSGLSGNGQIAIAKALLGLRVQLTTIPSRSGRVVGDPDHVFDVGEVSLGDADGWFYTRRIDRETLVWTPKDAQLATLIGYSIPADTVARVTELVREP